MSYPANHFIEQDEATLKALIRLFPLAHIICTNQDEILTSYAPLLWKGKDELTGHLDQQNPQAKLLKDGKKVKLIFNGPEAYISPAHFQTNELPTFNYCKIEIEGKVFAISDETLKQEIIELTQLLEGEQAAYKLTKDEKRLHTLVNYIHGFKIKINAIRGRFKMSQDKSLEHQKKAMEIILKDSNLKNNEFLEVFMSFKK